jgi:hypothetical protein
MLGENVDQLVKYDEVVQQVQRFWKEPWCDAVTWRGAVKQYREVCGNDPETDRVLRDLLKAVD